MMMRNNVDSFSEYLDYLFPNPKCELNYNSDYELLIAVMLSAQTTDRRVNMVTKKLFEEYPSIMLLKDAKLEDIIRIIRPLGTYNRKAIYVLEIANTLCSKYDSKVPNDRKLLEELPGVGRKVANVVLSEWFKEPNIAVDTHVERVSKRLGLANEKDSVLVVEKKLQRCFDKSLWGKRHLQMVLFGRYYCMAVKPKCAECKLIDICKYKKKK